MPSLKNLIRTKTNPVFLISRTDSIGDVILTLPMAGVLKSIYPNSTIVFLGKTYTEPIVALSSNIDKFINWDSLSSKNSSEQIRLLNQERIDVFINVFPSKKIARLAKRANIPIRIATSHRIYNWLYSNRLISFSRNKSLLHEAQLNIKLIECLGAKSNYSIEELNKFIGIRANNITSPGDNLIDKTRFNLILHPKSKGSAREWGIDNYNKLISLLPQEDYNIFITGTKQEGDLIREEIVDKYIGRVYDLTGIFSLEEFISFIGKADGLIAASTGPLHIASILGINALGLYPPIRPMHPGRWRPIGEKTKVFVRGGECSKCRNTNSCECMLLISPNEIANYLDKIKMDIK
ncbi:MAG: glycosyltransferase family 9 protein [Bacteroidales bacterium]|nr:glycosyltransferase family 9 protein [Bacteroidales bacterium]